MPWKDPKIGNSFASLQADYFNRPHLYPVLQPQPRHPLKLADIVATNQRDAKRAGAGRNPQVVIADGCACAFQRCTNLAVVQARVRTRNVYRYVSHETGEAFVGKDGIVAFVRAKTQFAPRDGRNAQAAGRGLGKPLSYR